MNTSTKLVDTIKNAKDYYNSRINQLISSNASNTLFLGNGFSRAVFEGVPAWDSLFGENARYVLNNTIRYEIHRLDTGKGKAKESKNKENEIKESLIGDLPKDFSCLSKTVKATELESFGFYLRSRNIDNIITTNYDLGIEFILSEKCKYTQIREDDSETVYSIRRCKVFENKETGHTVTLWKIHGDILNLKSIMLGLDQYCGAVSRITSYVKGTYSSSHLKKALCSISMEEKCKNRSFDGMSWVELFFRTNVYVVGFGFDFSEIDIWWILNKRARFIMEGEQINNTVTYLYNKKYDNPEEKKDIFSALQSFDIVCTPLNDQSDFLNSIFEEIK